MVHPDGAVVLQVHLAANSIVRYRTVSGGRNFRENKPESSIPYLISTTCSAVLFQRPRSPANGR